MDLHKDAELQDELHHLRQRVAELERTIERLTAELSATRDQMHHTPSLSAAQQADPAMTGYQHTAHPPMSGEERYRIISELISDYAYAFSLEPDGTFVLEWVTDSFMHVTGFTDAPGEREAWKKLIHPDDMPLALQRGKRLISGQVDISEFRIITRSGEVRWLCDHAHPVWSADQSRVVRVYGAAQDITERKQAEIALQQAYETLQNEIVERRKAEQALKEREQTLEAIFNASPDLISNTDVHGKVLWTSPAVRDILGREPVGREGVSEWAERIHPEDLQQTLERFQRILGAEHMQQRRYRVRHADGHWVVLESRSRLITDADGQPVSVVAVSRDVTNQVALETRLIEARIAAETAVRHKDEFMANISHELRTPLNTILGLSEALQEEMYGPLTTRQHRSVQNIQESGGHLLELINDVLDIARIEAGQVELELTSVALDLVCHTCLRLIRPSAHQKQLTIVEEIDSDISIIRADTRRLKQILVNLLNNAVKFTPAGGQIGLEVTGDLEYQMVRFTVWDTGIGIAPEHMDMLFKPFIQIDAGLNRQHGGTGLGLALVARLTEMHGGSVTVESELDKGSRFTVSLPWLSELSDSFMAQSITPSLVSSEQMCNDMVPQPPESERGSMVRDRGDSTPLILLADDSKESCLVISECLLRQGYRVETVYNGYEAVERASSVPPSLILMDMQMPRMDGLDAIRRIRTNPHLTDVPIIALTALVLPGDREHCLEAGANDYMCKPVSANTLLGAIETCLQSMQRDM